MMVSYIDKLIFLNQYLVKNMPNYENDALSFSNDIVDQERLFRSLMNVSVLECYSNEFIDKHNEVLQYQLFNKGVVSIEDMEQYDSNIYLWKGDITRLSVDAIVNAANNQMLGCFIPCHGCIDNAIHSSAGVLLRLECKDIMSKQGYLEPTGSAKLTKAYNLPCKHVIHTVGPIIYDEVHIKDITDLENCYKSVLNTALSNHLQSIAICCISTGEYRYPNKDAAKIAINTVKEFLSVNQCNIKVIFNVFKEEDYEIYKRLLG